jgi:hypothetical protein
MNTENKQPKFPYVSFPTFKAFIFYLHDTVLPDQIDNTMMPPKFSGSARAAVTATLKSLGLIDAEGNTASKLKELVAAYDSNGWQEAVKKCILSAYDELAKNIDLKSATRKQMDGMFEEESPQMRDKYIRFFLTANKEAGIGYSPHISIRRKFPKKHTDKTATKHKTATQDRNVPPAGEIPNKEQTPSDAFDVNIFIQPLGRFYIRIPNNITVKQAGFVVSAANHIADIAKQNEESE